MSLPVPLRVSQALREREIEREKEKEKEREVVEEQARLSREKEEGGNFKLKLSTIGEELIAPTSEPISRRNSDKRQQAMLQDNSDTSDISDTSSVSLLRSSTPRMQLVFAEGEKEVIPQQLMRRSSGSSGPLGDSDTLTVTNISPSKRDGAGKAILGSALSPSRSGAYQIPKEHGYHMRSSSGRSGGGVSGEEDVASSGGRADPIPIPRSSSGSSVGSALRSSTDHSGHSDVPHSVPTSIHLM